MTESTNLMERTRTPSHSQLDGKALREAVWQYQQQQCVSMKQTTRVIRYDAQKNPLLHEKYSFNQTTIKTNRLSWSSRLSLSSEAIAQMKRNKYNIEWTKDEDCMECQVCHRPFTTLSRRRHHCRVCGNLICSECSHDHIYMLNRFNRPKRACIPCFALFSAMMQQQDPRIALFSQITSNSKTWLNITNLSIHSRSHTPRHSLERDLLKEIQRVTAAGAKARRDGDESKSCVISAAWLREWLAYTTSMAGLNESQRGSIVAPGPIRQLSLVEIEHGCLVPLKGLIPCEGASTINGWAQQGDYQLIPATVWEVLHRYYGGGPRIEVNEMGEWEIDIAMVMEGTNGVKGEIEMRNIQILVQRQTKWQESQRNRFNRTNGRSISLIQEREEKKGLEIPQIGRSISAGHHQSRGPSSSNGKKTTRKSYQAAQAASAFAEAMKQARLNAQKSMDEGR